MQQNYNQMKYIKNRFTFCLDDVAIIVQKSNTFCTLIDVIIIINNQFTYTHKQNLIHLHNNITTNNKNVYDSKSKLNPVSNLFNLI